ncbi:MAG TPA: YtxH domain-containing protein [Candidatus Kapabacteria bacterium]|nr:YtxH domain-containing protein [Candidatus Kapabacteria bacterium]
MTEKEIRQSSSTVQSFLVGAVIGGAVGAVFALLYAPKRGKDLREDISSKVTGLSSQFSSLLKKAKEAGEDLLHDETEVISESMHDAYQKAEELIDEADRIINDARARMKTE